MPYGTFGGYLNSQVPGGLQNRGLLERITQGLLGTPESYGGLLGPQQKQDAQRRAQMAMAASLLQAGGVRQQPMNLGEALGGAIQSGQQAQDQAGIHSVQSTLLQRQLQQKAAPPPPVNVPSGGALVDPSTGQPIYENQRADLANTPSSQREWDFYIKLSPADQKRYLEMKRTQNPYSVVDLGQVPTAFNRQTGATSPLSNLPAEIAGTSAIAGATEAGKTTGGAQAAAQVDLPKSEQKVRYATDLLTRLEVHPGLSAAVGVKGPSNYLPGTSAADFRALSEQVSGQVFLDAYQDLKGGGSITAIEGEKAEQAIARIRDRNQSEGAYREAARELKAILKRGLERKRAMAQGKLAPAETAQPTIDDLVKKYGGT